MKLNTYDLFKEFLHKTINKNKPNHGEIKYNGHWFEFRHKYINYVISKQPDLINILKGS